MKRDHHKNGVSLPCSGNSMSYNLDGQPVELVLSGPLETGVDECLIQQDDNLAAGCSWEQSGFTVDSILALQDLSDLVAGIKSLVIQGLEQAGVCVDKPNFQLEDYHTLAPNQTVHLSVIDFLRGMAPLKNLPIDPSKFNARVSEICEKPVSCDVESVPASGYFFIRIVRPYPFRDNNPPHKDVWLDRLRHAVNLYLPIAGSGHNSSLSLVEGSHYWPESRVARSAEGTTVNGVRFSVPAAVSLNGPLNLFRPEVGPLQGLVFSPYLIHGGAVNRAPDKTRVSLEMRFWRNDNPRPGDA